MKTTLFCKNPYAFGILRPIYDELIKRNHPVKWFVPKKIVEKFPFKEECDYTTSIQDIYDYKSDVIFTPGNGMPYYLRGFKTQVFHGLAGEKKGHFRIRHYFDLYLTQGPYFTNRFKKLANKHKDFEVFETGWPKLDQLFREQNSHSDEKKSLLEKHNCKRIVLYAPTFSPSLTSTTELKSELFKLAIKGNLVLIKFHDLMDKTVVAEYKEICKKEENAIVIEDNNIIKYLILADILISDTSSVVYEFLLLDKPVITLNSSSKNIKWKDISKGLELGTAFEKTIVDDEFKSQRRWIIDNYHPYNDGLSSARMVDALEKHIEENPIPEYRKISWLRRRKMQKVFGKVID
jgi:CDP-glycerol glycerophosphotransferase (TagB/SpsB family)